MDESDVVNRQKVVISDLIQSIARHRDECPDHDIRVIDQKLWSVIEMIELIGNAEIPENTT